MPRTGPDSGNLAPTAKPVLSTFARGRAQTPPPTPSRKGRGSKKGAGSVYSEKVPKER
jgi:hypothetical protein